MTTGGNGISINGKTGFASLPPSEMHLSSHPLGPRKSEDLRFTPDLQVMKVHRPLPPKLTKNRRPSSTSTNNSNISYSNGPYPANSTTTTNHNHHPLLFQNIPSTNTAEPPIFRTKPATSAYELNPHPFAADGSRPARNFSWAYGSQHSGIHSGSHHYQNGDPSNMLDR